MNGHGVQVEALAEIAEVKTCSQCGNEAMCGSQCKISVWDGDKMKQNLHKH